MRHTLKAFTLMEIIIVVVILGVLTALAVPRYLKTVDQARRRDALTQLRTIHAAQQIYRSRTGKYWPGDGSVKDTTAINSNLGLSITQNGMAYSCTGETTGEFRCQAVRDGNLYTITVTQGPLSSTNPDPQ